jgi:hypothetical protein
MQIDGSDHMCHFGDFLKKNNDTYVVYFDINSFLLSQNRQFFSFSSAKIFQNYNIGPWTIFDRLSRPDALKNFCFPLRFELDSGVSNFNSSKYFYNIVQKLTFTFYFLVICSVDSIVKISCFRRLQTSGWFEYFLMMYLL